MTKLSHKVTEVRLLFCEGVTEDVVAPFVAKHGPSLEWLCVTVADEASTDGLILLLNGCVFANTFRLENWRGLDQQVAGRLFPTNHLHLTKLEITASPLLDDVFLAFLLSRCPALKSVFIALAPLVSDSSLETIASKSETLCTWILHDTSITTTAFVKLVLQFPACPFDSISLGFDLFNSELKPVLLNMGDVGRGWIDAFEEP